MNEKTKTPIESMADLLAEMTERAMEAERQRDAAREEAATWYRHHQNKVEKLAEAEAALVAQIKENEDLRSTIAEYIEQMENGGTENV